MKSLSAILIFLTAAACSGQMIAEIQADFSNVSGSRWEAEYAIENTGTEQISELTIWFDYEDYTNFEITTADPQGWDEMIIAAEPLTESGAGYDLLNASEPITTGEVLGGFSVEFDYAGSTPQNQSFEIINPNTYETLYEGQTVPEPATIGLFALAGIALKKRKNTI
ncbi:hypothetical protein L21SP3_01923 [Sedimentisphaera cyanobacteriorum]|uniref:Ice-binding protein C-terminal domain-containing protein n=1 Tax=Sedimentisphaera cyanobacteriorum TaxID=1940790 RepID=A0A1Q2HRL9_9BACT|nr:PEP-CTERM sorting domain-containing protein [Sedimentisphaera cyanobacteriorum]AQQ10097.1 hypothetical protein L21SP3_01923 [Sedimentisphaera cyanobacteriorum]